MAQGDGDKGLHARFPWEIDQREVVQEGGTLLVHGRSPPWVSYECL